MMMVTLVLVWRIISIYFYDNKSYDAVENRSHQEDKKDLLERGLDFC